MKMDAFIPAIPEIAQTLGATPEDGHRASVAITTTGEGWGVQAGVEGAEVAGAVVGGAEVGVAQGWRVQGL